MSNLVEQITDAMISEVQTALGSDYSKLCYFYDVSKNNFISNAKRFGVIPSSGVSGITPLRTYTIDHEFQVVITDNYFNKEDGDESQRAVIEELYEQLDEVTNRLYAKKLGIPSIVFFVTLDSMESPEFIEEDNVAIIRANFVVKYRRSID